MSKLTNERISEVLKNKKISILSNKNTNTDKNKKDKKTKKVSFAMDSKTKKTKKDKVIDDKTMDKGKKDKVINDKTMDKGKKTKKDKVIDDKTMDKGKKDKKSKKEKKMVKVITKNKKGKIIKKVVVNPLCDTCLTVEHNKMGSMFSQNEENWKNFPNHLPILGRKVGDQVVEVNLGKKYKNRLIYYFATRPSKMQITKTYPDAYKNSKNNGLMVLDKDGKCQIHLDCPLHYKDIPPKGYNKNNNEKQGYVTHFHILVSDSKMGKWEDEMFTQSVLCKIGKYQYNYHKVKGNRVIINAIDKKYNLPGTFGSMDYQKAKQMTPQQIRNKVKMLIKFKLGDDLIKNVDRHNIIDTPLLVYCHNPECDAAKELVTSLYKAGFYNILYYPGGFLDYFNREK